MPGIGRTQKTDNVTHCFDGLYIDFSSIVNHDHGDGSWCLEFRDAKH